MIVDLKSTETHQTVTEGRLSGDQVQTLFVKLLTRELGLIGRHEHPHGYSLELTLGDRCLPTTWPDAHFTLTKDHNWHRKPTPDAG